MWKDSLKLYFLAYFRKVSTLYDGNADAVRLNKNNKQTGKNTCQIERSQEKMGNMFMRRIFLRNLSQNAGRQYEVVFPETVTKQIAFSDLPKNISIPPYAKYGLPQTLPDQRPEIKSAEDIQKMKRACSLAKKVLQGAGTLVKPGVTTQTIDDYVFQTATENGAYPSPLNYRNFPKSVCTSVNNCACHGIPDSRELVDGDIVNVDVTVFLVMLSYCVIVTKYFKFLIPLRMDFTVIAQKPMLWVRLMKKHKS